MGLAEVLPRLALLRRRIAQTAHAIADQKPRSGRDHRQPRFLPARAAPARAAQPDLPVVHYVAPSVWAWRPKRAARMARLVDHVLALLPFEPPYMQAAGMTCDFVGHPVVSAPRASEAEAQAIRQAETVVLALPGSRGGEIARLAPRFGQALGQALPQGAQVLVPTVASQTEAMRAQVARWPIPAQVLTDADQKRAAFRAADVALAASGTVSLELAANDTPMVIGYDMAPLTRMIAERFIKLDTVTLVNLVSDTRAVPEYLGRPARRITLPKPCATC